MWNIYTLCEHVLLDWCNKKLNCQQPDRGIRQDFPAKRGFWEEGTQSHQPDMGWKQEVQNKMEEE